MITINLSQTKYKSFTFPHNPYFFEVVNQSNLQKYFAPMLFEIVQNLGANAKIVRGYGFFFGENCLNDFLALENLFNQPDSGLLSLPTHPPFFAFFSSLKLSAQAGPFMIQYEFEFVEDTKLSSQVANQSSNQFHCVADNQTLYDIANLYSTSVEKLLELNPTISSPFNIITSDIITISP